MTNKTKIVYQFNKNSTFKEYLGPLELSEEKGDLDLLESEVQEKDVWLIPGDCVDLEPVAPEQNKIVVYTGDGIENHSWGKISDYVGTVYWDAQRVKHTITQWGVDIPAGATLSEPPLPLEELKAKKKAELTARVDAAITSGFRSNALGSYYWYGSNSIDQINLTANYASALNATEPSWTTKQLCGDGDNFNEGSWVYRDHTKEQMIQVGETGKQRILTLLVRHNEAQQLLASLETNTPEKVAAINFDIVVEGS